MLKTNKEDMSISLTRGDSGVLDVKAKQGDGFYEFQSGDKVFFRVSEAKDAGNSKLEIEGYVNGEDPTLAQIELTEEQTKSLCEPINKPVEFWYEISLENGGGRQTLIGYDEDGAKILRLFPEIGE